MASKTLPAFLLLAGRVLVRDRFAELGQPFLMIELPLAPFMALLRFHRKGSGRSGQQALQADGLAGFFAIAIYAVADTLQCRVDFLFQLAFPIARAQLQRMQFFLRGAVCRIGKFLMLP